jgi:hypothetical protein
MRSLIAPAVLAAALAGVTVRAAAQELTPAPGAVDDPLRPEGVATVIVPDDQRPVSPMGAFWRSLLIPGWGQAKLNRKLTGALFIGFEGIAIGMVVKTTHQLEYVKATGSESSIESKEAEQEDWLTLLVFNHLLSGVEAFVAAHLWNFPDDLRLEAIPGEYGAQITVPVRLP